MSQPSASRIVTASLGAAAVIATLCATQLAIGGDLDHEAPVTAGLVVADQVAGGAEVNRVAKTDRARGVAVSSASGRTIAIHLQGDVSSSVLVRITAPPGEVPSKPRVKSQAPGKSKVACEAVVSVLTEVAKDLEPGRCLT